MTNPTFDPSPWEPEADPMRRKVIGKLAEEAAELAAVCARCLIQGLDESEPVTGKFNKEWLEDEIADVEALIFQARSRLNLNIPAIRSRTERKYKYISRWIDGDTRPDVQKEK